MYKRICFSSSRIYKLGFSTNLKKNSFNEFIRHYADPKRFYKQVNVSQNNGKFEVALDQKKLKTPKGNLFYVESEPLALGVAAEWDAQKTSIVVSQMHLTGLCNTVLDNPNKLTKEDVVKKIIKYLDTDTVLYISDKDDLLDLQLKEWLPIINWFCKKFNINIEPSKEISGPFINSEAKEVLRKHLLFYNFWGIHGLCFAIEALKSVILGLTCLERHVSVEKAVFLSRLEEEYQSKCWGRIEWSHELNQQDTQARVAAGILFAYVNSSSTFIKNKANVM